jgi:hypothetical protein
MVPPIYHSLRREQIQTTESKNPLGVQVYAPRGSKIRQLPGRLPQAQQII